MVTVPKINAILQRIKETFLWVKMNDKSEVVCLIL